MKLNALVNIFKLLKIITPLLNNENYNYIKNLWDELNNFYKINTNNANDVKNFNPLNSKITYLSNLNIKKC